MQCEHEEGCDRAAKVKVGDLKYCVRHYNKARREAKRQLEQKDLEEIIYDPEDDIVYLRAEAQKLVNSIDESYKHQMNCANISCRMSWRQKISNARLKLNKTLDDATSIEEGSILMGKEKHFQQQVRKYLREIGWKTYKHVGNVSLPGMPDIMGIAAWGGIAFIEFKAGTPLTEQEALKLLHGPQKAVMTDMAFSTAPAIVCVGDLDRGTIVEIGGLINKNQCGILHYVHVAEVACQIEGWLRAWTRNAHNQWEKRDGNQEQDLRYGYSGRTESEERAYIEERIKEGEGKSEAQANGTDLPSSDQEG